MTTIHVQNRSPHRLIDNMTTKEALPWTSPCIDHLWIFGYHAYIHVPKDKWKKLDSTSIKCVFVGYVFSSKAYKKYIKEERWIEVSMDVIFEENHAYKRSKAIPIESDEEDAPLFEEEEQKDKSRTYQEEEGPSEPIQPPTITEAKKRLSWLRATLE